MKEFQLLLQRRFGHVGLVVLIVIGLTTQPHAQSAPVEDPFLPLDASLVAYSIAFALEGHTSPPPPFRAVHLKDGLVKPDPDLVPGAFHIDGLQVYAYSPVEGAPYQRQFAGLIVHRDLFGRYASHSFLTRYRINRDETITVETATVIPIPSNAPPVQFAIVPADRVEAELLTGKLPVEEIMFLIAEEDIKVGDPRMASGPHEYIVFAIFMERVSRGTSIVLETTIAAGTVPSVTIIKQGGWRIAYAKGHFNLTNGRETIFRTLIRPPGTPENIPLAELVLPVG